MGYGANGRSKAGFGQRLQRAALAVVFAGITVTGAIVGATGAIALPTFTDTQLPDSAANPLSAPTAIVPLLDTGASTVTLSSLQDSRYGDLTTASGTTCATGASLTGGGSYSCTFNTAVSGSSGSVADTVTATAHDASAV